MSTKADISDLVNNDPSASNPVDSEEEFKERLPEDVQREMDRCKAFLANRNRNKPGAPEPQAFYVVACGEHVVFGEPSLEQFERLIKVSSNESTKAKAGRQICSDLIFWMRGQTEAGPQGAWSRMKEVSQWGGMKVLLMDRCAGILLDQLNNAAGDDIVKKL